jgi:hypothetical protein
METGMKRSNIMQEVTREKQGKMGKRGHFRTKKSITGQNDQPHFYLDLNAVRFE